MAIWELAEASPGQDFLGSYCNFIVPFSILAEKPPVGGKIIPLSESLVSVHESRWDLARSTTESASWAWTQRTEYFTGDVVDSLYRAAAWFHPEGDCDLSEGWKFKEKTTLQLDRVVVFERPPVSGSHHGDPDPFPLQLGFAVLKAAPKKGCSLAEWMEAVEKGRYLKCSHKDQDAPMGMLIHGLSFMILARDSDSSDTQLVPGWPIKASLHTRPSDRFFPDDRAFVSGFYVVDVPAGAFGLDWEHAAPDLSRLWHQILYVEPSPKLGHPLENPFENRWMRERTYERWRTMDGCNGTLYGWSHYSAMALTTPASLTAFPYPYEHWRQMYLDLQLLLLYQRAICVRASSFLALLMREQKEIFLRWEDSNGKERFLQRFSSFRARFTMFTNLYWDPILSNTVQGIEMYLAARAQTDTQQLFDELSREVEITDNFLQQDADRYLNKNVSTLVPWSIILAALGVLLGFFSANFRFFNPDKAMYGWNSIWVALDAPEILVLVLGLLGVLVSWNWMRRLKCRSKPFFGKTYRCGGRAGVSRNNQSRHKS